MERRLASLGVETFTSLVLFIYAHCVLPSNQMVVSGVMALNLLPFIMMLPDVLPTSPPVIEKLAAAPPRRPTTAAALSKTFFASAEL